MNFLELRNIRTFTNSGAIRIAPITILVGQNSSGKSTFARFFPLLKQGAESRTREPILWLGRSVDFGSAEEARSKFSQEKSLGFSFELQVSDDALSGQRRYWYGANNTAPSSPVNIDIDYVLEESLPSKYVYLFRFKSQEIGITIDADGFISQLKINNTDRSDLLGQNKLSVSWTGAIPTIDRAERELLPTRSAIAELLKFIKPNLDQRTKPDRVRRLADSILSLPIDKLRERAPTAYGGDAYWKRVSSTWEENSPQIKQLKELVLSYQFFNDTLELIALYARLTFFKIQYITPIRARAERYYRLQGLAIEEIDSDGENVAMYLHNLTPENKAAFEVWMKEFFGVSISTRPSQGHVSLVLIDNDTKDHEYNLADTGFGYSQILPIMIQLWKVGIEQKKTTRTLQPVKTTTIFAIEQPELHLHPKLQAKLADVFISAIKAAKAINVDLRLVVETHSEQIISRLGVNVARQNVKQSEINIALFEKETLSSPTNVREVEFNERGTIKSWPIGFFDAEL